MRQQEVLETLRKQGDWVTRTNLAKALGRPNKLNQLDLQALAVLEAIGQIEVDRRPDPRPVKFVVYYRAKG